MAKVNYVEQHAESALMSLKRATASFEKATQWMFDRALLKAKVESISSVEVSDEDFNLIGAVGAASLKLGDFLSDMVSDDGLSVKPVGGAARFSIDAEFVGVGEYEDPLLDVLSAALATFQVAAGVNWRRSVIDGEVAGAASSLARRLVEVDERTWRITRHLAYLHQAKHGDVVPRSEVYDFDELCRGFDFLESAPWVRMGGNRNLRPDHIARSK